jgi:FtsZ-binding cell division protein ZapB
MKEPIIQLSLKDYEELKQFKDNALKKNFLAISKGCFLNDYTNFHFYSDEEMSQKLFSEIELLTIENNDLKSKNDDLKSKNDDLKSKNDDLKNDLKNQIEKTISYIDELVTFNSKLKKMNIFQFLKWKKIIKIK